jgi:hypothetical protein
MDNRNTLFPYDPFLSLDNDLDDVSGMNFVRKSSQFSISSVLLFVDLFRSNSKQHGSKPEDSVR